MVFDFVFGVLLIVIGAIPPHSNLAADFIGVGVGGLVLGIAFSKLSQRIDR